MKYEKGLQNDRSEDMKQEKQRLPCYIGLWLVVSVFVLFVPLTSLRACCSIEWMKERRTRTEGQIISVRRADHSILTADFFILEQ